MTNAVFFVSCPSIESTRILLLRIYGPSSGVLISRPKELQTLHVLSSKYHIGPCVYGTFENGRVEEHFDATTLTAADMRSPQTSSWIGARMAELHNVDVQDVEEARGEDDHWDIAVAKNVQSWLAYAREVLALPGVSADVLRALDLDAFENRWRQYARWLQDVESAEGVSRRVFAHNDTQYGNLLRLKTLKDGMPEHRQIIVVDFEYAAPNAAAFDIANHFHEWTANYHLDTPHLLNPALYPSQDERRNFYRSYITHCLAEGDVSLSDEEMEVELVRLDRQVQVWSPASHAMWAVWGVVQAREMVEGKDGEPEFDYLGYATCRMEGFRREAHALGLSM
ncbi:kinase-like protein [Daedalea quercina L-15889]|uniref:Kinase-like protein n=1 Tax=Daedalea quercina L-15889 TaxID=1314783 RepID=A0A165UGK5_9APHY|nr:kinase-like protein [Daedalea quercina L-15889]